MVRVIRKLPMTGRSREVAITLYQWTVHMGLYAPFTCRGLVEFLLLAEHQVDYLGYTPFQRSIAASQLIQSLFIQPAENQHFPTTLPERNQIEHHQMRLLFAERPQAVHY